MLANLEPLIMRAINARQKGDAATDEEAGLIQDLPDNLKKWQWIKQQIRHATPLYGTGEAGGDSNYPAPRARQESSNSKRTGKSAPSSHDESDADSVVGSTMGGARGGDGAPPLSKKRIDASQNKDKDEGGVTAVGGG
eukprot:jgi/Mesvir1/7985/Mv20125-RA.1